MFLHRQTIPLTFAIEAVLRAGRLAEAVTPKVDVATARTSRRGAGEGVGKC